jgi:hypothetical protein
MYRGTLTAEWIKLRSVRSTPLMLLTATIAALAFSYLRSASLAAQWRQTPPSVRAGYDPLAHSLAGVAIAIAVFGAIGCLCFTSEYSCGLIRTTLTATPQRLRVLAAKAVVIGAVTLCAGEAVSIAAFYLGRLSYSPLHIGVTITQPAALRAVICSGLVLAAIALLGLGLGAIIRHTAGALTALAAITFVIPGILTGLPAPWNHQIGRFTVIAAATQLLASKQKHEFLTTTPSVLVILAYPAITLLTAALFISRRDA